MAEAMPEARNPRDRWSRPTRELAGDDASQKNSATRSKAKAKVVTDGWVEPPLAPPRPSYRDNNHGVTGYGVLEHMQPLGEFPSAKVRARVKPDGARKAVTGRSSAAVGIDTPEGSPVPPSAALATANDDKDGDYAPRGNGQPKTRSARAGKTQVKAPAPPAVPEPSPPRPPQAPRRLTAGTPLRQSGNVLYNERRVQLIVDSAKARAVASGRQILADSIHEVYVQSKSNYQLRDLLESIIAEKATPEDVKKFQFYIQNVREQLKDAKQASRQSPAAATNGSHGLYSLADVRSSKPDAEPGTSAIPSIEHPEDTRPDTMAPKKSPRPPSSAPQNSSQPAHQPSPQSANRQPDSGPSSTPGATEDTPKTSRPRVSLHLKATTNGSARRRATESAEASEASPAPTHPVSGASNKRRAAEATEASAPPAKKTMQSASSSKRARSTGSSGSNGSGHRSTKASTPVPKASTSLPKRRAEDASASAATESGPSGERAASVGSNVSDASDSSLTSLSTVSPPDDGRADVVEANPPTKLKGLKIKGPAAPQLGAMPPPDRGVKRPMAEARERAQRDHTPAAKRQKVANGTARDTQTEPATKRSSAEARLEEDEAERVMAARKEKLAEGITRDIEIEESSIRGTLHAAPSPKAAFATPLRSSQRSTKGVPSIKISATKPASANSTPAESPLSEISPALSLPSTSRQATPAGLKAPEKPVSKRAKTKQSPQKKATLSHGISMQGMGGARKDSPGSENGGPEQSSENNDFCAACGGSGYLLCCDGCTSSFHFTCLDPPLEPDAKELEEPWYCYICVAKKPVMAESTDKPARGLFGPLLNQLKKTNPENYRPPAAIRDYFEGVGMDAGGNYIEAVKSRSTRNRPGYSGGEKPDYQKLHDAKGNVILCYFCTKSALGQRDIITCDYCNQHWHLDCLDPPLANPPAISADTGQKIHDWMCPLHVDHELRTVDTSALGRRRQIHIRRPKNPKLVDVAMSRGFRNNGIIEVADDESDQSDSEFYDHDDGGTVYRLPSMGIKLDFIDKVKNTRVQELQNDRALKRARDRSYRQPSALEQANFAKRPFAEQQMALNLAQFATDQKDLDIGNDEVDRLLSVLIAEAPAEVVQQITAAEQAEQDRSASSAVPPSPPSSDQPTEQSVAEQRRGLEVLQELIRRKLEQLSHVKTRPGSPAKPRDAAEKATNAATGKSSTDAPGTAAGHAAKATHEPSPEDGTETSSEDTTEDA